MDALHLREYRVEITQHNVNSHVTVTIEHFKNGKYRRLGYKAFDNANMTRVVKPYALKVIKDHAEAVRQLKHNKGN